MGERMVRVGAVELCVETFGRPEHPAILLIAGSGASMDSWDDDLCVRLADGLRYVVRYDHRDTGRSTSYPAGAPAYSGRDLANDALGVLDALGIERAHLVGISMGGGLVQSIAGFAPDRVLSLMLLSTSPIDHVPGLPPPTEQLRRFFADPPSAPDPADRAAMVEHLVALHAAYEGSGGVDVDATREYAARVVDRTRDMAASLVNHGLLVDDDEPAAGPTGPVPTLVVHGTEDPLFPFPHGEALAARYDAELLPMPGLGHRTPPREYWDRLVPALLRHTSGGWPYQADRLAAQARADGEAPTAWFDRLYSAADDGAVAMPWDRDSPQPLLAEWAAGRDGTGRRAVVVGAGLGADAEFVASLGYETTAFDVADTAVRLARERHPGTTVRYVRADLFDLPAAWRGAYELVVEVVTVQALPRSVRAEATRRVGELVAPGGTLLVVSAAVDEPDPAGPPWPLTRAEIDAFAGDGLTAVRVDRVGDRWRAEFRRG